MSQLGWDLALFCRANSVLANEMLGRAHYMGSLTKGFHPTRKFLVQNYTVTADGRSRHSLSTEKKLSAKGSSGNLSSGYLHTICGLCGQALLFS